MVDFKSSDSKLIFGSDEPAASYVPPDVIPPVAVPTTTKSIADRATSRLHQQLDVDSITHASLGGGRNLPIPC
jgi:hypothetical protein